MFTGERKSVFGRLPPEMVTESFLFLKLSDLKKCRLVCQRWRWIIEDPDANLICFKAKIGDVNSKIEKEDAARALLKSRLHYESVEIMNLNDLVNWPMINSQHQFPSIQNIAIGVGNCNKTVLTILKNGFKWTESLTIAEMSLDNVNIEKLSRELPKIEWNNLSKLDLKVFIPDFRSRSPRNFGATLNGCRWAENHLAAVDCFLKSATLCHLRKMQFDLTCFKDGQECSMKTVKLISSFWKFIVRHTETLKKLILCYVLSRYPNFNAPGPEFNVKLQESLAQNLKLETLDIQLTHYDALVYLVPPCLWNSKSLTKFVWSPYHHEEEMMSETLKPRPNTKNPLETVLHKNETTLKSVKISFFFLWGNEDPGIFNIIWLQSFNSLKKLSLIMVDAVWTVDVRLPTVTILECLTDKAELLEMKGSEWIARTFQNMESIQIGHLSYTYNAKCGWIQNLLPLRKLQGIRFHYPFDGNGSARLAFKTSVKEFCKDKHGLKLKSTLIDCLISIIPRNNYN